MFNIYMIGRIEEDIPALFGSKYDITDDVTQANVILCGDSPDGSDSSISPDNPIPAEILESRLAFAAADLTQSGLDPGILDQCSEQGICVFRSPIEETDTADPAATAECVRNFIENGNIVGSVNYPAVDLGPFADDVSRISVLMKGIDAPVLLGAMMTSEMDIRAVAGGLNGTYGAALIAGREPVSRLPHVDGVLKVRVLQDI